MTELTTSQLSLPTRRWLSAAEAAAYVGVDADEFRAEVADGLWPAAMRVSDSRGDLWDRIALDRASDQVSGVEGDLGTGNASASPLLLTATQAARLAGCSVDKINRSDPETLPRRGQGRQALFDRDDVVAFAKKERRHKPERTPVQIDDLLARYRK
jgi:hypothetical protein